MNYGVLDDHFEGLGCKLLTAVEIDPNRSNGHEFNGVSSLRDLLGTDRKTLRCRILFLTDHEDDIVEDTVDLTWYDARAQHASRTEYRLYYQDSDCFRRAKTGDVLVVCRNRQPNAFDLTVFLARADDTITNQLMWLLGVDADQLSPKSFSVKQIHSNQHLDYFQDLVLSRIGIATKNRDDSLLDALLEEFPPEKFSNGFPRAREFSEFARSMLSHIRPQDDPDEALIAYLDREEQLFRTLERHLVGARIRDGFEEVDDFIGYSLSIQNRRKSRAGLSLEYHLCSIFDACEIAYSHNRITENRSRPDFVFPGIAQYHEPEFSAELLTMLGAKTSCKERWRQVLAEAERIKDKHLITLEPGVSEAQTLEMASHNLQLVVPRRIIPTYHGDQQQWLMDLSQFIDETRAKQIKLQQ